jgi:heat shock protein HslJ
MSFPSLCILTLQPAGMLAAAADSLYISRKSNCRGNAVKSWLIVTGLLAVLAFSGCGRTTPPLAGTEWELEAYGQHDRLTSVVTGTRVTLNFAADSASVGGSAGCNIYGGDVEVDGNKLTISNLFQTEMYCLNPPGVWEQEVAFLHLLGTVLSYSIDDGRLVIDCTGAQLLVFDAVD